MGELVQLDSQQQASVRGAGLESRGIIWLQAVTLAWMLVECGVSIYAAKAAHSPAMLAFGSDSLVELLSATVVLLQYMPTISISRRRAARIASFLLLVLAVIVATIAVYALVLGLHPETSRIGMVITIAALIVMPLLAIVKRREGIRQENAALAADAVQSAVCAYLALITLAGLAINAGFQAPWVDPIAALIAVPLLVKEARSSWLGQACGCC